MADGEREASPAFPGAFHFYYISDELGRYTTRQWGRGELVGDILHQQIWHTHTYIRNMAKEFKLHTRKIRIIWAQTFRFHSILLLLSFTITIMIIIIMIMTIIVVWCVFA